MKYDLLVFIGRFQPFHAGHKCVVDEALKQAKEVLILVGSAGKPRTVRNPFTYEERKELIRKTYMNDGDHSPIDRIHVRPLYDRMYNDTAWVEQVQEVVKDAALDIVNYGGIRLHGLNDFNIGLIGFSKDNTSYYLKLFPQWGSVNVNVCDPLNATEIREEYFAGRLNHINSEFILPEAVRDFMFVDFQKKEHYTQLKAEMEHVKKYKKSWESAPYPVKHVTVDAVVEQSGHILLVRRRSEPGKGLWALPGGHLNLDETLLNGAIRELREETGLKVPVPVLKGSIKNVSVFDDPHRSNIGRVITTAYHFKLVDDVSLPKVKGMDDADKAEWIQISEVREDMLFDDHFHIIHYFLGM